MASGKYIVKAKRAILALGPRFKETRAYFSVDYCTGLPIEEDPDIEKYLTVVAASLSNPDTKAEGPKEDGGDLISAWLEVSNRDDEFLIGKEDLVWKPPPDLDNPSFEYSSEDTWKTNSKRMEPEHTADRSAANEEEEVQDILMAGFFKDNYGYWFDRHVLFSKFEAGIKMDEEGLYSATPECIAKHHAFRCGKGVVLDLFTGVGGNAIRFAEISTHVIAVDIDPKKIEYAKHNAAIYEVQGRIDFITADSIILAKRLKANTIDTVFLSPPWGGREYAREGIFDLNTMLKPCDGQSLFNLAKEIAPRVVMFLPKNVGISQLADMALSASPPWTVEVEENYVNGNLKAITAYFTDPSLQ